jgi:hypothetical protein
MTPCSPPREIDQVSVEAAVEAGRAAWARLRDRDRKAWSDWVDVGKALVILRDEAMAKADVTTPFGKPYTRAMGAALRLHGFDDVLQQARYRIMLCMEHIGEIEAFRSGLDEKQLRRMNHPDSVWWAWQASKHDGKTRAPQRRIKRPVGCAKAGGGRSTQPCGDVIRHVAMAMRENWSTDTFLLATVAIRAYESFLASPPVAPAPRVSAHVLQHEAA